MKNIACYLIFCISIVSLSGCTAPEVSPSSKSEASSTTTSTSFMETSHTAQTASAHVTIKAASNLTADRISPPDTTRRPTTRATKKTNSNITTSRKRPTTPTFSMPTTGDIYYGDLPAEKQAQYKAERDALDEKFVSDAQKILDEIEEVEADIDSATAENSFEAEALREEIRQLELERQNAVAEALAQSGGQWNSYAQTIDNQYKALIAQKQSELNSLTPNTTVLEDRLEYLQNAGSLLYEKYELDLQKLNDKYGIKG